MSDLTRLVLMPPPPADLASLEIPVTRIRTDEDVEIFKQTTGFRDYALFVRRLNDAVRGHTGTYELTSEESAASQLVRMLRELAGWTKDIPPLPTPQRFGNLAFRDWGRRLEERADSLVSSVLGAELASVASKLVTPYLLASFGSFVRIDYGTGHELAFGLLLLCCDFLGLFPKTAESDREIVLVVFREYMRTVWIVQDVYKLEPAGSHGVWGLDDFFFLSYLWGSSQLIETGSLPNEVLQKPVPEPQSNLYFASIDRVHRLKQGPFHEHSPQLHAIASQVPHWGKVNSGMFKMYEAEVLSKRVVVQHLPLGGLVKWDPPPASTSASLTASPSLWAPAGGTPAPVRKAPLFGVGAATNILPPPRLRNLVSRSGGTPASSSPMLPPSQSAVTAAPWAAKSGVTPTGAPLARLTGPTAIRAGTPWTTVAPPPSNASPVASVPTIPPGRSDTDTGATQVPASQDPPDDP
ncbi:Phosphotyrosyl phosphatase activator [Auriculariales sp. MPI-PUGE-AT-0066]|nr:Phosphotyrosyl phosphatase activator [Auriculariales sp. MPI-PUGE-AT-0066]